MVNIPHLHALYRGNIHLYKYQFIELLDYLNCCQGFSLLTRELTTCRLFLDVVKSWISRSDILLLPYLHSM